MIYNTLKRISLELRKQRSTFASTVQFHLSEIQKIGKNLGNRETSEEEAIQYLKKTIQRLKENKYSNKEEILLLEPLLPENISDEVLLSFIQENNLTTKKDIMRECKKKFGSAVDMRRLSQII